jgi:hypothetical protein
VAAVAAAVATSAVAACGGGGGGGSNIGGGGGTGGGGGSGWQQGVFLDADTFFAQCASPRSGTGDMQGTTTDEKNFLRSYSNDTYLWYEQLPDIDPGNSDTH